jgi:ABC-2 type transport system ATP-binding protein
VETERPLIDLHSLPDVHVVVVNGKRAELQVEPADLDRVLRYLIGFGVRALTSAPPSLEEMFMRHYDTSNETGGSTPQMPQNGALVR